MRNLYGIFFFLACALVFPTFAAPVQDQFLVGKPHCADFRHGVTQSTLQKLKHAYICPSDGIAGTYCADKFPTKDSATIVPSSLAWSNVVFYVLIGPSGKFEPLLWWLKLVVEPIDLVFVGDACKGGDPNDCTDAASDIFYRVKSDFPFMIRPRLVRSLPTDSGYSILSCKLRTGQKLVYEMFPKKSYYFKFDTDTIIFPRRLMSFMQTIDAVALHGAQSPLYFGTMVESGIPQLLCKHHTDGSRWVFPEPNASMCYCQGGAGYGLSNVLMKHMAQVPSCSAAAEAPSDLPEDLFTALEVYNHFNRTVGIHCGGFRSSELVGEALFEKSISFHYIDAKWLRTHGDTLHHHYHEQHQESLKNANPFNRNNTGSS
jgi:hypothetical protein